jgi:hypothetical protein
MDDSGKYTLAEAHLAFAKQTNGEVWGLLDKRQRSEEEARRMLLAAYTSQYHWLQVGTEVNQQRAEWLIARVYNVLGEAGPAMEHANRCLELTENYRDQMADFDMAFAYEEVARSNAHAGNQREARRYLELATAAGAAIADAEDKEIFMADLEGGDWHGIR